MEKRCCNYMNKTNFGIMWSAAACGDLIANRVIFRNKCAGLRTR